MQYSAERVKTWPARSEFREPTFWKATWVLTRRWLWRLQREPVGLVAAVVQPIFWLLLFGHLFSGTVVDVGHDYIAFITAGVLTMTVFGAVLLGSGILCLSTALAFSLSGHSQFFTISSVVSLPLSFMSSALVPLEQMPSWL